MGAGREAAGADSPVEQAHDALDDSNVRDVRGACPVGQQRCHPVLSLQVRVEVATGAATGQGVVARVDVVGADLVR